MCDIKTAFLMAFIVFLCAWWNERSIQLLVIIYQLNSKLP